MTLTRDQVTAVLVPGAGGESWYWHRVVPLLAADPRVARVVAVDLPAADDAAGWTAYRDTVLAAVGEDPRPLLVAGQSLGGFTAPLVAAARPTRALVLLNAMVPTAGETAAAWGAATRRSEAAAVAAREQGRPEAFDEVGDFFHDVPADLTEQALARPEAGQSGTPFEQPWPAPGWPDVPTTVVVGALDRLFPPAFQRRVARERLGTTDVVVVPGGHLAALSVPGEVTAAVLAALGPDDPAARHGRVGGRAYP